MESDWNQDTPRTDPGAAAAALVMVEQMRKAALQRALPPRWLGLALSALIGGLCGSTAADLPTVTGFLLLIMSLIFAAMRRTLVAMAKRSSFGFSLPLIAGQACAIVLIMAMIAGGRIGFTKWGMAWAPVATALGCMATIYVLFEFKLSHFRANLEMEEQL